ncbi:transposase-like zinc-binding domain-containing protein [Neolewinella aquimaris]
MLICPDCQGGKIVKNGRTLYGRQNHKCTAIGYFFWHRN